VAGCQSITLIAWLQEEQPSDSTHRGGRQNCEGVGWKLRVKKGCEGLFDSLPCISAAAARYFFVIKDSKSCCFILRRLCHAIAA
jgi:hypothetical protein